jgi:hypothetical protein
MLGTLIEATTAMTHTMEGLGFKNTYGPWTIHFSGFLMACDSPAVAARWVARHQGRLEVVYAYAPLWPTTEAPANAGRAQAGDVLTTGPYMDSTDLMTTDGRNRALRDVVIAYNYLLKLIAEDY